jgi:AmmeMemoRadiSam system protein B
MRNPVVNGKFYESDKEKLISQIDGCFGKAGKKHESAKAIIVPHAGYFFSGKCAAKAYSRITGNRFIIFGPNHYGSFSGISMEMWKTPLGEVNVDEKLAQKILLKSGLVVREECHFKEHSIEVQLPFLQHMKKDFTFVPISLGTDIDSFVTGKRLKFLLDEDATIIISTDFTHYGPGYGYMPFAVDVKKNLKKLDMGAIELIQKKDYHGFRKYLDETNITICGYMGILVLLSMIEDTKYDVELLDYYTSGDVLGDYRNSVSYASLAIR